MQNPADNTIAQRFSESPLGLYVHVPFCATTCDFCAFVQSKPNRANIKNYLNAVEQELQHYRPSINKSVSTVFWGGGTPGLLSAQDLEKLGEIFAKEGMMDSVEEWTIEMAPATITPTKLKALKRMGVTRISMGIQTFSDKTLEIMGRYHSSGQVLRAWEWIQNEGFKSTNIDMIIAFPGQSENELLEDLSKALSLNSDHISTYCLTFEEDTPLYAKLMKGVYKIDLENEAQLYQSTWNFLEERGLDQYEISNFAKPLHASQHNLNTWKMHEWIGFGPSASSQFEGSRWTNSYDLEKWMNGINHKTPVLEEKTQLDEQTLIADSLIFGLRKNEGVNLDYLKTRFPNHGLRCWQRLFDKLQSEELAVLEEANLRLTLEGRLKADAVGVEILNCQD